MQPLKTQPNRKNNTLLFWFLSIKEKIRSAKNEHYSNPNKPKQLRYLKFTKTKRFTKRI